MVKRRDYGEAYPITLSDWRTMLTRYAEAVERGDIVTPDNFSRRCVALERRGLSRRLADDLYATASAALLRQVEALDPADLLALNEAAKRGA